MTLQKSLGDHPAITFSDHKDADALRTIGEVSNALNIRQHVLRYWEEQFPMLRPVKRSGGRRYYRPEDVRLLATIDRLVHREGYTLRGAKLAIEGGAKASAAKPVAASSASDFNGMAAELREIRKLLTAALAA